MGRRDRAKQLVRFVSKLMRGGPQVGGDERAREPAPEPTASAEPVRSELVETGDLWAVRYAVEPQGRPLVINHWATWCDGCVEELPLLVALYRRHGDKVPFVGIGWELFQHHGTPAQAADAVRAVAEELGVEWRTLIYTGEPDELFSGLELKEPLIPQTLLLDGDGVVRFHHVGAIGRAEHDALERAIKAL